MYGYLAAALTVGGCCWIVQNLPGYNICEGDCVRLTYIQPNICRSRGCIEGQGNRGGGGG